MLRNGEIDLYTAAKITPEREKAFVFSKHPAITSTTCMNVKRGNTSVTAGDYSTYNGLKIGLLKRHTYEEAAASQVIPHLFHSSFFLFSKENIRIFFYSIGSKSAAPCLHSGQIKSSGSSSPS